MIKLLIEDPNVFRRALIVPWHPRLVEVYTWLCNRYGDVVASSVYRTPEPGEALSVHNTDPCRGLDWINRRWTADYCRQVERDINDNWLYDHDRPQMAVCKYHTVDPMQQTGWHFHCQGHESTIFRG